MAGDRDGYNDEPPCSGEGVTLRELLLSVRLLTAVLSRSVRCRAGTSPSSRQGVLQPFAQALGREVGLHAFGNLMSPVHGLPMLRRVIVTFPSAGSRQLSVAIISLQSQAIAVDLLDRCDQHAGGPTEHQNPHAGFNWPEQKPRCWQHHIAVADGGAGDLGEEAGSEVGEKPREPVGRRPDACPGRGNSRTLTTRTIWISYSRSGFSRFQSRARWPIASRARTAWMRTVKDVSTATSS